MRFFPGKCYWNEWYHVVDRHFSSRCGTSEVRCKFMPSLDMITPFAQFLLDLRYPLSYFYFLYFGHINSFSIDFLLMVSLR